MMKQKSIKKKEKRTLLSGGNIFIIIAFILFLFVFILIISTLISFALWYVELLEWNWINYWIIVSFVLVIVFITLMLFTTKYIFY
jgi:hypothetical protein